jgi:hypothetical protein
MRTKTILLAMAALAAGLATSQAQSPVYSANVVGYVNIQLTNGFNAVANQMDFDGTGTNNTIYTSIGTNLPTGTKVYAYDPSVPGYRNVTLLANGTWQLGASGPFVTKSLQPGGGVFVFVPGSNVSTNLTLTGTVLQETNLTTYPAQYQMVGYAFPVSGYLTTNFNYSPNLAVGANHDTVLQWNPATQLFTTHRYLGASWQAGSPNLGVAESFFLIPDQSTTWTNGFVVSP